MINHVNIFSLELIDQSYCIDLLDTITIENSYGIISADNVWGALYGLETFSQLLFFTEENYVRIFSIEDLEDFCFDDS
jgi:hypothetical protein